MKRGLMVVLLGLVIVGCGKNYKVYTQKEKREMYDIALEEKKWKT